MRLLALPMVLAVGAAGLASAQPKGVLIGVYDQRAAFGQGADVTGLITGLRKDGYQVRRLRDASLLTIAQCDILYLSDTHDPGTAPDWRQIVPAYVRAGGSVLQTWHHHILGQIGIGVRRVYGSRHIHVVAGSPAVAGLTDFDTIFSDHIVEQVGPRGTPLLKDEAGNVVAAAGALGRGKVISTGLALAIPNGRSSAAPRGPELTLLKSFLKWLTPDVPRSQRLDSLLPTPSLFVSPPIARVPAGMKATYEVKVVSGPRDQVRLTVGNGEVSQTSAPQAITPSRTVHSFRATLTTSPQEARTTPVAFTATVGGKQAQASARLTALYAPAPAHECRGIWLHVGMDRQPKDVMPELKRLGLNTVMIRIAGGTAAYYASKVQPDIQDPLAPHGDWLAEAVKYAHANGLKIYAWVNNCIVEGRTSPRTLAKLRAAGRLQVDPQGKPIDWFCPSQEVNLEAIERPMLEIVSRYHVDGVQYDFIRYPNERGCFCDKCRRLFEQTTGKPVLHWPADVISGPRHEEWVKFRCDRISALVQRMSTDIRRVAPHVKISAAVFSDWPQCRETVGQDWVRWCKEGWLDSVCPMNYTLNLDQFMAQARIHRQALPPGFPVMEGIGIASGSGTMTDPEQFAAHIVAARAAGAAGFMAFCYQPQQTRALLAPLTSWLAGGE